MFGGDTRDGRAESHPLHNTGDIEAHPDNHGDHARPRVAPDA